MNFLASLRYNLAGLLRFSGRDSKAAFWPYAAFILIAAMVAMMLGMAPVMGEAMANMAAYAAKHPERATIQPGSGGFSISIQGDAPGLMPDMGAMMVPMGIVALVTVVLLAAAVVRRLHDCGRTGWWGLMPLPFLTAGSILMPGMFAQGESDLALFFAMFFNNMLYIGLLALLAVLLAGQGQPGENRYGPAPAA